jgi:hypothetical protein
MVNTWNYFTAYMVVRFTPNNPLPERTNLLTRANQLFGLFVGIFLLGIPIYFLNPKVRKSKLNLHTV